MMGRDLPAEAEVEEQEEDPSRPDRVDTACVRHAVIVSPTYRDRPVTREPAPSAVPP